MSARESVARNGRGVGSALVAWLVTVGIDLFFNAGLFSPLFDQDREPGLAADEVLFRRVPFAYVVLLVGVGALTVILDLTAVRGVRSGAAVGAVFGAVAALLGVFYVWTAIDMTGLFVAGGALVQIVEFAAAGAVIGAYKETANRRRVTQWAVITALMAAVLGIVIQNLLDAT